MEKDAYYFPHFCNARRDRKIQRLRKELGLEGYGIFFMLLETLREQADFKYPCEDFDILADEFGTSEQKVRTVICNYGLFEVDENEMFFSPKFIFYLSPYLESKEQSRISGIKGNLIKNSYISKEDISILHNEDIISLNEIVKSGGDRGAVRDAVAIKVNEIKLNEKRLLGQNPQSDNEVYNLFQTTWSRNPKLVEIPEVEKLIKDNDLKTIKRVMKDIILVLGWKGTVQQIKDVLADPSIVTKKKENNIDPNNDMVSYNWLRDNAQTINMKDYIKTVPDAGVDEKVWRKK